MATSVQALSILSNAAFLVMEAIQAGQAAQNQKDNCRRLVDRLKLLLPLLEDVKRTEIANNLAAAATFERLELALRKTKDLLERCSLPCSRVYMVIHAAQVVNTFQDVTMELHRCLTALPLVCLKTSDSIRSQVAKINGDFRTVRYAVDAQTRHTGSELELLVMEHRKGVRCGQEMTARFATQLGLHSREIVKGEQETLERAKIAARAEKNREEEEYLTQIISLLSVIEAEVGPNGRLSKRGDGGRGGERRKAPKEYCCPLSLELLADPVIVASGQTFERAFIERWLEQGNMSCPVTRQVLSHTALIPNEALKSSIATWCKAYGVPVPQARKLPPNATIKGPGLVEFHAWMTAKSEKGTGVVGSGLERTLSGGSKLKPAFLQGQSRRTVRSVRFDPALDKGSEQKSASEAAQDGPGPRSPAGEGAEALSGSAAAPALADESESKAVGNETELAAAGVAVDAKVREGSEGDAGSAAGDEPAGGTEATPAGALQDDALSAVSPPLLVLPDAGSPPRCSPGSSPNNSAEHALTPSGSLSPVSLISVSSAGTLSTAGTPPAEVLPAAGATHNGGREILPAGSSSSRESHGFSASSRSVSDLGVGRLDRARQLVMGSPVSGTDLHHSHSFSGGLPPLSSPSGSAEFAVGAGRLADRFCPSPASSVSSAASYRNSGAPFMGSPQLAPSPKGDSPASRRLSSDVQISPRGPLEHAGSFSSCASSQDDEAVYGAKRGMVRQGSVDSVQQPSGSPEKDEISSADMAELKALVRDVTMGTSEEKRGAALKIREVARASEATRRALGREGIIKPLVGLLAAPESALVESAVYALLNLSISDANKEEIGARGAVGLLVRLFKSENEIVKEGVVGTLFSLSVMDDHKLVIAKEGAIPCLVDVLVTGTRRAKQDAMLALFNLSIIAANKVLLLQAGIVKPIVYIARKGPAVFGALMVDKAVSIMSNLSFAPEGRHGLATGRAIPVLCQIVEEGSTKSKEDAAACLLRLCVGSPNHRSLIWKEDVLAPLMMLAHAGSPRGKTKAKALLQELNTIRPEPC